MGPEGRSLNSFGKRKRRSVDFKEDINLREMFRVYETRSDIPMEEQEGNYRKTNLYALYPFSDRPQNRVVCHYFVPQSDFYHKKRLL